MAVTTALKKIKETLYRPTFYKVIQGGMSAGKSYAIMTLLVAYCESYDDSLCSVVGMSYKHLSTGTMRDFEKIMKEVGHWEDDRWSKSEKIYYFRNGSKLEFLSVDNMSARGPRRDVLFVNEANGITYEVFSQLSDRTKDFAVIDYNPSAEFWAHTELVQKYASDTDFLILTYADNEALGKREVANIERHRPKKDEKPSNWWTVYGLGQVGTLEGNIYSGWEQKERPEGCRLVRYGLDFGFSNDETALVSIWQREDDGLHIEELIYQTGLLPSQYVSVLKRLEVDPSTLIIADGARPEIIAEIKNAGFLIAPADKGAGSVVRGISRVQEFQISYDGKNLNREFLSYQWKTDKSGNNLGVPKDGNDHIMDAIRYGVDSLGAFEWGF